MDTGKIYITKDDVALLKRYTDRHHNRSFGETHIIQVLGGTIEWDPKHPGYGYIKSGEEELTLLDIINDLKSKDTSLQSVVDDLNAKIDAFLANPPKGEKGDKGEQGSRGEQGLQGWKGDQGLPGNPPVATMRAPIGMDNIRGYHVFPILEDSRVDKKDMVVYSGPDINAAGIQIFCGDTFQCMDKDVEADLLYLEYRGNVRGPQGEIGLKGDTGPQGIAGLQGAQGIPGVQGVQGPEGQTGPVGPKGEDGTSVNIKGSKDDVSQLPTDASEGDAYLINGDLHVWTGTKWDNVGNIKGPQGDSGPQGLQGPQGQVGPQGATGSVGPQGLQGDKGDKGDTGLQGLQGLQGPQGAQGIQGLRGEKGATGRSTFMAGAGVTIVDFNIDNGTYALDRYGFDEYPEVGDYIVLPYDVPYAFPGFVGTMPAGTVMQFVEDVTGYYYCGITAHVYGGVGPTGKGFYLGSKSAYASAISGEDPNFTYTVGDAEAHPDIRVGDYYVLAANIMFTYYPEWDPHLPLDTILPEGSIIEVSEVELSRRVVGKCIGTMPMIEPPVRANKYLHNVTITEVSTNTYVSFSFVTTSSFALTSFSALRTAYRGAGLGAEYPASGAYVNGTTNVVISCISNTSTSGPFTLIGYGFNTSGVVGRTTKDYTAFSVIKDAVVSL